MLTVVLTAKEVRKVATVMPVRRAARLIGVHENTIRNWADRGIIQSVNLPGSNFRRIPTDEVERVRREMWGSLESDGSDSSAGPLPGVVSEDDFTGTL
jgi:excisionase family DNA binding protein